MLPANFQIHLDYSPEQRFMVEFAVSQRRRLIDVTTKEMNDTEERVISDILREIQQFNY